MFDDNLGMLKISYTQKIKYSLY